MVESKTKHVLVGVMVLLTIMVSGLAGFTRVSSGDVWTTRSAITTPRAGPVAAAVNNKVYVFGGYNNTGFLNSVEAYDAITDTWVTRASMPTPRHQPAAAVVNNKIYVIGGYYTGWMNTVEEYDPATNTWRTGLKPMPTARESLVVAAVNNKIYAIDGYSGFNRNTVEEYDPTTNNWTTKTPMPSAIYASAAAVVNNKIYVMGGWSGAGAVNTVYEYDPATDGWATKSFMPTARMGLVADVVYNKIYAIGGWTTGDVGTVEEYNPSTDTWGTGLTSMPTVRRNMAVAVVNDKIYVIGGRSGGYFTWLNTVEEYTPNQPPVATSQSVATDEDTTVMITLTAHDPDGDPLTFVVVSQPQHGSLSGIAPNLFYTPETNYNGMDSFTFKANDGTVESNEATVMITIIPVNDPPDATHDTASTELNIPVTINVLYNDYDVDGDTLTVTTVTQGGNGFVTITNNDVTYTPRRGFSGVDTFAYTISDGHGGADLDTVTVTVTLPNRPPVARADTVHTAQGTTVIVAVLDNDFDPDGDSLIVTALTQGEKGLVTLNPDGTVNYEPDPNFRHGQDSFTYTISDGRGGTSIGRVIVLMK